MKNFKLQVGKILDPAEAHPIYLLVDQVEGCTTLEDAEAYAKNLVRFAAQVLDTIDEFKALRERGEIPKEMLQ